MPKYHIVSEITTGFYLVLNPMRGRMEEHREFGPYQSKQEAINFHNSSLAPATYQEEGPSGFGSGNQIFTKAFNKGSPLEWMNPLRPMEFDQPGSYGHGIYELVDSQREISKALIC